MSAPTPPGSQPSYLPDDVAEWMRRFMSDYGITATGMRNAVYSMVEATWASGYSHGYGRGHGDNAADVEARVRSQRHGLVANATSALAAIDPSPLDPQGQHRGDDPP